MVSVFSIVIKKFRFHGFSFTRERCKYNPLLNAHDNNPFSLLRQVDNEWINDYVINLYKFLEWFCEYWTQMET